jgi:deoxyribodipyrimidine photo-lyase
MRRVPMVLTGALAVGGLVVARTAGKNATRAAASWLWHDNGMGTMNLDSVGSDPRVTVRRPGQPDASGRCVVYWMQRAQRALDNPALDLAIATGNALGKPVVVYFGLVPYPCANLRHYQFMVEGLPGTAARLAKRGVGLVIRRHPDADLAAFCEEVRPAVVIGDENPTREPERWRQALAVRLRVPFWTVDADVIVPTALIPAEQFAARTIRPKIHAQLERFLVRRREPKADVGWKAPRGLHSLRPDDDLLEGFLLDRRVAPVAGFRGGTGEALKALGDFVGHRLAGYGEQRNKPERQGTSRLSPWLHFGHIGPRTVALAVRDADAPAADRDAFLEEFIVRRELAVNFVRSNPRYDSLACAEPWAERTLREHARDRRPYLYTERQLEHAETHDPLWNAAQRQMVATGWMHGYVRMYWGKKILEWSRTPEEAFDVAVRLNDRYELDGRDPNGYAGIAWAIAGKHDRAWGPVRPIYGTVRYMSFASTSKKFDSRAYMAQFETALR